MKNDEGSLELGAVLMLMFIAALIGGGVLFAASGMGYMRSDTRDAAEKNAADLLLDEIVAEMQPLALYPYDHANSEVLDEHRWKHSGNALEFDDISSGYNLNFLSDADLADPLLARFIFRDNSGSNFIRWRNANGLSPSKEPWREFIKDDAWEACVSHGWLHASDMESFAFGKASASFGAVSEDSLFPLVNYFPRINVNAVEPEILRPLILRGSFRVQRPGEKADALISRLRSGALLPADISSTLQIPVSHPLMAYLGTKTAFWKITLRLRDGLSLQAVVAAIPKKDGGAQEIERYQLIERSFIGN